MSEKSALSTEQAEQVRHLIGNPIFAIETSLPSLTRCVENGESGEALKIIAAIQRCLETAKTRLHDLDVPLDSEVKFEPFDSDEGENGIVLMSLDEFRNGVNMGMFTNDDGTGFLVTTTLDNDSRTLESNQRISPGEIASGKVLPAWATHVAWYNK